MSTKVDGVGEKQKHSASRHSTNGFANGEAVVNPKNAVIHEETAREAAERGHAATDK
jgi:hypothetical protein